MSQVVKGLRQSITKRSYSGAKRKTLQGVADYLYRNRTRMRYHQYLANGWPIASGPVEGAYKNLIKDRMGRSGMRWTEQMAEAIVQLRAIYPFQDFDRYWQFTSNSATLISCLLERRSKVATHFIPLAYARGSLSRISRSLASAARARFPAYRDRLLTRAARMC
ncbi:MAG TPA: hypothetical protein VKU19_09000 [Bryobacteraceae bacterium]|nr:hypothetical protein [Bryobacteraceae bacterium]